MEISWSPDETKLYFDRHAGQPRGIFSVAVLGGGERLVLDDAAFPEVLPDGSMMIARINAERQLQIHRFWPETGRLQAFPAQLRSISGAPMRVFPDGREVVFLGRPLSEPQGDHLYVLDLDSGRTRQLAKGLSIPVINNLFPLAVTRDGKSVLVNLPSGSLHRIVAIPRSGAPAARTLLTLTLIPWYVDAGPNGDLYLEQIDQPCEILRFAPAGGPVERIASSAAFRHGSIAELPDGRVLAPAELAGHSRLMVVERGREPVPLLDTGEETAAPVSMAGPSRVAFLVGSSSRRRLALASVADGRVESRLKSAPGDITSLAASPDGRTLFFAAAKSIWTIPSSDGEPRRIGAGDGVVVTPDGRELIVKLNEGKGSRLIRMPASGGAERPIPFEGDLRLTEMPLASGAAGRDGRILVQIAAPDTWYWHAAILDPATGVTQRVPVDYEGDLFFSSWAKDGKILALGIGIKGGLWRFRSGSGARAGFDP